MPRKIPDHCPICGTPAVQYTDWRYCPRHHQVPVNIHIDGIELSWDEVYKPGEGWYWLLGWGDIQPPPEWEQQQEGEYGCN
jgi:hypothetical protein